MPRYANGQIPDSELVHITGRIWLTPATAARFAAFFADVLAETGVQLYFSPQVSDWDGYNGYRSLANQTVYRSHLGIQAAVPGYSPHGGTYKGADCMAADIGNWNSVPWATFKRLAEKNGLAVDQVTPTELWHVNDYNPWVMPTTASTTSEEDDMNDEQDARLKTIEQLSRPLKMYALVDANGNGGYVYIGESGNYFVAPNPDYVSLIASLKLSTANPIASMQQNVFDFVTKQLLPATGKTAAESQVEQIVSLDADTVKQLVAGITSNPVTLTTDQLSQITAAAAKGGADAIKGLSFVTTVS